MIIDGLIIAVHQGACKAAKYLDIKSLKLVLQMLSTVVSSTLLQYNSLKLHIHSTYKRACTAASHNSMTGLMPLINGLIILLNVV